MQPGSTHTHARTTLELPALVRARLDGVARARYPHEACGLLIGRRDGLRTTVMDMREARNLNTARAHERYEIDPVDHLAAEELGRRARLEVIGIWHTHPDRPAVPSETDRKMAWHGWSYLIVSAGGGGRRELRSWRLEGEGFLEEEVLL